MNRCVLALATAATAVIAGLTAAPEHSAAPTAAEFALAARTHVGTHLPASRRPPAAGVPVSYQIVPGEHYLVPAGSAPALARALGSLPGAEVAAGGQFGWVAPASGAMAATNRPVPTVPGTAHGRFPLRILQLNVTGEDGRPASNADVEVVNTDDVTREQAQVPVANGVGRITVPAGHYSAFAYFFDGNPTTKQITAIHIVTINDFTVPATRRVTTVSVDERSAIAAISAAVPRPARRDVLSVSFYRQAAVGNVAFTGLNASLVNVPVYVDPVPAASIGRLHYVVQWGGIAPGANPAYRYDVAFAADRVPADEAFRALSSQLATVHQHFSADPGASPKDGQLFNGPVDPVTARGVPTTFGVNLIYTVAGTQDAMPGNLTDYLGTADGGRWAEQVNTASNTLWNADVQTFRAGQTYSVSWVHGPLAAGLGQNDGAQACRACIAGRTLSFGLYPAGDSEPDHAVFEPILFDPTTLPANYHFTLYRNGVRLADSATSDGAIVPGIPDSPATFRAVLDVNLAGQPGFTQSTRTLTDLTVRYRPGAGARLPAEDSCAGQSARTPCQILPALTLSYQLATDESNTSRLAVQTMGLRVGHLSYDGTGPRAAIAAAHVWVSFDGGTTWQPAVVTGCSGRYTVSWPNPASARGTDPAIRVIATDALGGSITQTIFNAYTIAANTTNRAYDAIYHYP
jgi:hypothetical protein